MNLKEEAFSKGELSRYDRHFILPKFGFEGQKKLKEAKVLVVGSGGLGSTLLLYLAAAGVGTIGIIDFDRVDESNLHRQVIFGQNQVGETKVSAAKSRLQNTNPYIDIRVFNERLTAENAIEIIKDFDVVADGTDNFPTRYLVNDACVLSGKPNVYGSIFQFEGQVAVFNYRDKDGVLGPNYRDLYESPPPPGLVPSCAESGVLGVLPGIIGSMQSLEVIKIITGIGSPLSGKLFIFDALQFESSVFKVKRKATNPLNGTSPTIKALIDYEDFCGLSTSERPDTQLKELSVMEFYQLKEQDADFQLIDVRERNEYEIMNLGGELMPSSDLKGMAEKVAKDRKVVLHCKTGARSAIAIMELQAQFGFKNLFNLKGGIMEYLKYFDIKR